MRQTTKVSTVILGNPSKTNFFYDQNQVRLSSSSEEVVITPKQTQYRVVGPFMIDTTSIILIEVHVWSKMEWFVLVVWRKFWKGHII